MFYLTSGSRIVAVHACAVYVPLCKPTYVYNKRSVCAHTFSSHINSNSKNQLTDLVES